MYKKNIFQIQHKPEVLMNKDKKTQPHIENWSGETSRAESEFGGDHVPQTDELPGEPEIPLGEIEKITGQPWKKV